MYGSTLPGISTLAHSSSLWPGEISTAILLFITLAALLAMFLVVVAMISLQRRRRAARDKAAQRDVPDPDIWQESGRRLSIEDDEGS